MEFKDSRTLANLMAAFAGESQAMVKYNIYALQCKKQGYEQIGDLFYETANNEQLHATQWLTYIHGGTLPSVTGCLEDAAGAEHYEQTEMYPGFAKIAKEEGYTDIAAKMELVAKVEKEHEERFKKLLSNMEQQTVFKKDSQVKWICKKCGHIHYGSEAPTVCPICGFPQAYFEEKAENY